VSEGDLNPETGEISLNLDLNSKTGEKSPDRGVHAAMVTGAPRLASSGLSRGSAGWPRSPVRTKPEKLVESRDGYERGNMTRPDGCEVPQVHRRDGDDFQPLTDGDHRGVRAAEPEIGVLAHES
jgi:hypothetical protein